MSNSSQLPDDPMVHAQISEDDLAESLQMLKTRVGQINAVFACFGSAAQHAQHFEAALASFLSEYNKISKEGISPQEFEILDQKLQKKTLGTLLKEFTKYITIQDSNIILLLERSLEKRNYLMHHFFLEREKKLKFESSRMELLAELTEIDSVLQESATIIRAMKIALVETVAYMERGEKRSGDGKAIFTATVDLKKT